MGIYLQILQEEGLFDQESVNVQLKDGSKKTLIVRSKSRENKNDKLSSKGVELYIFDNNSRIGKASISGIGSDMPFLYDFEVKQKYRGQGYGSAILDYCIKKYKVNDLSVSINNTSAIRLYEKHGFKKRFNYEDNGDTLVYMQIHKRGYENR